jgi:hypothetical protein
VTTLPLARNSWSPWTARDLDTVNAFEHVAQQPARVVMWYADWAHVSPSMAQLNAVANRGSIPEIDWEPWDSTKALYVRQPRYSLKHIIDGSFDAYIRQWARTLAAFGRPIRLRFAQEMNGNWYPWSERSNGNRPGEYVRTWRHVHRIFDAAHASNVRWVWNPAAVTISPELYPGNHSVDIVGLIAFNGGAQLRYLGWRSPQRILGRSLAALAKIAPHKSIELSEIGVAEQGGNKAQWITELFKMLKAYPNIRALVWYDLVKESDWRIDSSRAAAAAFRAGVRDPRYF